MPNPGECASSLIGCDPILLFFFFLGSIFMSPVDCRDLVHLQRRLIGFYARRAFTDVSGQK